MSRAVWGLRRARAVQLLREAPHAEQILVFYAELTEIQERVAEQVPVDHWLDLARSGDEEGPLLLLERLPHEELMPLFNHFLGAAAHVGTDVIQAGSRALLEVESEARRALVAGPTGFHARAFLEPVMTTLAAAHSQIPGEGRAGHCPQCGSLPVVGLLRDLPETLGARSLVCSLCATEWRASRLRCIHCGEDTADNLLVHTAESLPYVRLDECRSCERYLKTLDLRRRGDAVPVVDELATVALDLWARERSLKKLQKNVLDL